jgi:hypothetical protein
MTMPQLPSGRHVALMPKPLDDLLKEGRLPGNIHKVLAIQTEADVFRYVDVLYLVPESEAGSQEGVLGLHAGSLPVPPGMAFIPAGFRLAEWEKHAAGWNAEDRAAFREFLAGRCAPVLREYLDTVRTGQARLREADDPLTRILVGWWDAGCHPAQEEGWNASDVGSPDWDDCDLLAALGQARALLPAHKEFASHWQAQARLDAFWNICRRELPLADGWPAADRSVRECAAEARGAGWLEGIDAGKRNWLHDQAVAECVALWSALGDGFRAALPQPYGIVELVVVSPEANRCFGHARQPAGEEGRGG